MAQAELKTKQTQDSVEAFVAAIPDEEQRADCRELIKIMHEITGDAGSMWGSSIVGFGTYRYKYASGREGDWMCVGFSPRKQNLTLYLNSGFDTQKKLLDALGPHTTGKGCLYLKRLSDVDEAVLRKLIRAAYQATQQNSH